MIEGRGAASEAAGRPCMRRVMKGCARQHARNSSGLASDQDATHPTIGDGVMGRGQGLKSSSLNGPARWLAARAACRQAPCRGSARERKRACTWRRRRSQLPLPCGGLRAWGLGGRGGLLVPARYSPPSTHHDTGLNPIGRLARAVLLLLRVSRTTEANVATTAESQLVSAWVQSRRASEQHGTGAAVARG